MVRVRRAVRRSGELLIVPIITVPHALQPGRAARGSRHPDARRHAGRSDPRAIWRRFAAHYHLFRGTPSRMWLDWVFAEVFGLEVALDASTADATSTRSTRR
jgi:glucuronate isomerase